MLKKLFFGAAILWTFIVFILCLIKLDGAPKVNVVNFDKYIHCIFHFIFTSLWFMFFRLHFRSGKQYKAFVVSFLLSVSVGVLIELIQQYFTESRTGDFYDVLANMSGASLAISLLYILNSFKVFKNIR